MNENKKVSDFQSVCAPAMRTLSIGFEEELLDWVQHMRGNKKQHISRARTA